MNKQTELFEKWQSKTTRIIYFFFLTQETNGNVTILHPKSGLSRTISRRTLICNYRKLEK